MGLKRMFDNLPSIVPQGEIERFLPGIISKGYLSDLNRRGTGPRSIRIGKRVFYEREALIDWLMARSSNVGGEG
jgi:hypothetical protein